MNEWLVRFAKMEPAVFRGIIVSIVALLASVGVVVTPALSDSIVGLIGAVAALVAALWIKPAVTPNGKVVSYLPDPDRRGKLMPGDATTTASDGVVLYTARHTGTEEQNSE